MSNLVSSQMEKSIDKIRIEYNIPKLQTAIMSLKSEQNMSHEFMTATKEILTLLKDVINTPVKYTP